MVNASNMRSVNVDDLTTRARIRNSAIELIGAHGFDRASMRMIAQAAEVSPALVVHHFGDKDGLRAACNAHVAAMFTVEREGADGAQITIQAIQTALGLSLTPTDPRSTTSRGCCPMAARARRMICSTASFRARSNRFESKSNPE